MKPPPDPHYRHRFPAEIISQAVWLYHVFSLSLRDVELLLAERGVVASYETIRRWCKKFGQTFAGRLRRSRPQPERNGTSTKCSSGSRECSTIYGAPWIRRALCSTSSFNHGGTPRQSASSDYLLKGLQLAPRDRRPRAGERIAGGAAQARSQRQEHRQSRYLNNRAENSHRPTRRRERQMQRFKSPGQANDFLSAHAFIYGHFHPRRHRLAATTYRATRAQAFSVWRQDTCVRNAA